jgi:membrane-bound lytic murein transglycosylase B
MMLRLIGRLINAPMMAVAVLGFAALPDRASGAEAAVDFPTWLEVFRQEALDAGIRRSTIDAALTDIAPVKRIVERDRSQPEFKITFAKYLSRIASPKTVAAGRRMRDQNQALLEKISATYGVQPRFIMAIWGIETRFGAVKATMPVFPAVATLAWDRRRSKYFRRELMSALKMVDNGHIEAKNMKGSWAGAMGQPQFMPSSYLAYAVDFDGDGRRDIWSSRPDILGSIANYLAEHGWHDDQTWGREVRLPAALAETISGMARSGRSGCRAIDRMSVSKGLAEWQEMGVRRIDGGDLPARNLPASLVRTDDDRSFLVYRNYHSILRYNCAHLYGLTVSILADRIGDR